MILSYAGPDLSAGGRALVRGIEKVTGGSALGRAHARYEHARCDPHDVQPFNTRAITALQLRLEPHFPVPVPASGGLLIVSNHPMGPLDGLVIAASLEPLRQDVRTLIWDTIDIPPHARPHFLPMDLSDDSVRARRQNVRVRREAIAHLAGGGAVLLFPSGAAEITRHPFASPEEAAWTPLALHLARAADVPVQPVLVDAHNSRLFHAASHLGYIARRALYVRETTRRIGGTIGLRFGRALSVRELEALEERDGPVPAGPSQADHPKRADLVRDRRLTARLRAMTLALGG